MNTKTYDLTPEELEQKRLAIESELIAIQRAKTKAKWVTAWQITKTVLFPVFVVVAIVAFVCGGAVLGILGESLKKITR